MAIEINDRRGNAGTGQGTSRVIWGQSQNHAELNNQFPGLKKFKIYSADGGINHFYHDNAVEGVAKIHDSVGAVGKPGQQTMYTIHHGDSGPQIGGGVISSIAADRGDRDQRVKLHDESKPYHTPRMNHDGRLVS